MTDLRQAAQQALEALCSAVEPKNGKVYARGFEPIDCYAMHEQAIAALRTALEQQQAEPVCPECKAAVLYECIWCSSNNYPPQQQQAEPVAQREWVGLTPEEVLDLFDVNNVYGSKWVEFARTVESKLKEKNA